MPYQITVLVEDFPREKFRQPEARATAWGTAVRAEEAGKLFWTDDLYIMPEVAVPTWVLRSLPREWRRMSWKALSFGGDTLQSLEYFLREAPSYAHLDIVRVRELLYTLLEKRPRWAVFLTDDEANEEEVEVQYPSTLEDLMDAIVALYRREVAKEMPGDLSGKKRNYVFIRPEIT